MGRGAFGRLSRLPRPQWLPVLEAVLTVADRAEPYGGEFAGAWVLDELEQQTGHPTWLPNLRVLVRYGFLEKAGESTRGGRRAYYRCVGAEAIARALTRLAPVGGHGQRPPQDYRRVSELLDRYRDLPLGFVDAAVLAVVERLKETKLATLDHRHFTSVRPRHVPALRLIP